MATRPKLSWSDLQGARVGVWGLGVEGAASLRRLAAMGLDPVLVDDDPPADGTAGGRAVLATAAGGLEALARCDVVVKTPGVSRRRPEMAALDEAGVAVVGGLGLWMEGADLDRVVCVTGTKGKSTTASVAGHLLDRLGFRCLVAGNIGLPPYDPVAGDDYDFWVVEVSSFQATDLASAPPVVAVTSLGADHLDWHGDAEAYYADKLSLCTLPGSRLTVADGDSTLLRDRRSQLGAEVRWVGARDPGLDGAWADALGLLGDHNRRNALIARACLAALGVTAALEGPAGDPAALTAAAAGYPGLESRLRPVASVEGVTFVDDSLSTNVLPTLAALDAFDGRRVALLVGGYDRGIDYKPLAEGVAGRGAPTLVLTMPDSGPRIRAALEGASGPAVEVVDCPDLASATAAGFAWARPDGVVLLSPAAPSFGRFRDYRERAGAFAAAAASCASG
ncbi:MAG: UDP-N-acetylmuramoyl-L-alanine--D-glutamate ligase [Acidimicrobiales bacterium]